MTRAYVFLFLFVISISATAGANTCRPIFSDPRYSNDIDKFVENGGCLQYSEERLGVRGQHYLISALPRFSENAYSSELFAIFNVKAAYDILFGRMQISTYLLALSNSQGNNLALTVAPSDSFARSFRRAFGIQNDQMPLIVLYPRSLQSSVQSLPSVLMHEFEHVDEINTGAWRRFRDSIQDNIQTIDPIPERDRQRFLQSLFNLLIEFRPYVVQFQYLRDYEQHSLRQQTIGSYLDEHLNPYFEPVIRIAYEADNWNLFRSICTIVRESAPDMFRLPSFEFSMSHICNPNMNSTHAFVSVLCSRTYESYAIKTTLPSLTFERGGGGPINERIMLGLRRYFSSRAEVRRGDKIPDPECEIVVGRVHKMADLVRDR